jgi:hypothetical protein
VGDLTLLPIGSSVGCSKCLQCDERLPDDRFGREIKTASHPGPSHPIPSRPGSRRSRLPALQVASGSRSCSLFDADRRSLRTRAKRGLRCSPSRYLQRTATRSGRHPKGRSGAEDGKAVAIASMAVRWQVRNGKLAWPVSEANCKGRAPLTYRPLGRFRSSSNKPRLGFSLPDGLAF